jgi:hypothetical protein
MEVAQSIGAPLGAGFGVKASGRGYVNRKRDDIGKAWMPLFRVGIRPST